MPAGALEGDLAAQVGANHLGVQRFCELVDELSSASFNAGMRELDAYADRIMAKLIGALTAGNYSFEDFLDDDGFGNSAIPLSLSLTVEAQSVELDFTGSLQTWCQVTLIARNQWLLLPFTIAFAACCRRSLLPVRACSGD